MSIAADFGDTLVDRLRPRKSTRRRPAPFAGLAAWASRWKTRRTRIAVVGLGAACRQVVWQCLPLAAKGVEIVGVFADRDESADRGYCLGCTLGGTLDDLVRVAQEQSLDAVVLAIPPDERRRVEGALARLRKVAVDVYLHDRRAGEAAGQTPAALAGLKLRLLERRPLSERQLLLKAVEDRLLAAGILLAISPILAGIAIAVKLDSKGPVIFRQKRYGLNNRLIEVYKFRTLHVDNADTNAERLVTRNDSRVTRVGAFLRRTSLDELPQFFNVLRGDMSVVGPRPHAMAAKAGILQYDEIVGDYAARHRVKPGITGWAQVNGWRGETATSEQIEQRVAHDFFYIANWSLLLDLKIVLRTVTGGFGGRHAY